MTNFQQGINKVQGQLNNFGNSMASAGAKMSIGITAPLALFAKKAVETASDLAEIQNVVDVTFGESAKTINAWSKTAMSAYGLTELEAKKMASTMGAMTKSMGLTSQQSQDMAVKLTELSGDMSSFYNLPHDVTWEKIRAGISGETEPLKQLGINMSEATLATYAMAQGITTAYSAMSEAEKVQIRYNYLLTATKDAQGDFERTSGGFANQLRILQGEFINLSASIGQALLPMAMKLVQSAKEMIAKFQALSPAQKDWAVKIAITAAAIGPLLILIGGMAKGMAALLVVTKVLTTGIIGQKIAWVALNLATMPTPALFKSIGASFATASASGGVLSGTLAALRTTIMGLAATVGPVLALASALIALAGSMYAVKMQNADYSKGGGTVGGLVAPKDRGVNTQKNYMATVSKGKSIDESDARDTVKSNNAHLKQIEDQSKSALSGISAAAVGAGGSGGGAAQVLESSWQKAAKTLAQKLQELSTNYDISASVARRTSGEYAALQIEAQGFSAEIETQTAIVANSKGAWEASSKAKGENADETIALKTEYLNEQKALEDLLTAQANNAKAMEEQKTAVKELQNKIIEINDTYKKDSLKAYEDYTQGVAKANQELSKGMAEVQAEYENRIQQINANAASAEEAAYRTYNDSLNKRIESLRDFVGLFQAVTAKQTSGNELMNNLQSQVDAFKSYQESIAGLTQKGLAPDLLAELKAMGPSAAPELAALNNMTADELAKYSALWLEKSNMARESATDEMASARTELNNTLSGIRQDQSDQLENARIEMQTKLQEQQATAKAELETLAKEFATKNQEIKTNAASAMAEVTKSFSDMSTASTSWAVKLMQGYANGIKDNIGLIEDAMQSVQNVVGEYMPMHSPSKKGPLTLLNTFGPKLVAGYANGIMSSLPSLQSAMDSMSNIVNGINNRPAYDSFGVDTNLGKSELVSRGINIGPINITGSNADEIWDKFSRELAYTGVRV